MNSSQQAQHLAGLAHGSFHTKTIKNLKSRADQKLPVAANFSDSNWTLRICDS